ncbi:O-antigen ligase family protein [Acetatifactor muris]|uniref:O-Antigen ligase n=1 Tax=Acetatifactor muris TaxID=879566 RepID=A0A2K4ZB90_9FIRM|nr:O-antigen ligase family protein [Acetatifactor muris]MCI8798720.1 hypothetical protein [Lachnospiraceae bacterium]MCR2046157.1 O-antigen ligase family protein [Acetatifactor muris]SOY27736.1 O-Antigen ligase [Acetatifactor muris]
MPILSEYDKLKYMRQNDRNIYNMEEKAVPTKDRNEFLEVLCNMFIIALLVALPLYTGKGYWQLGDTKYMLFRNLSLLCLGGWLTVGMPARICTVMKRMRTAVGGQKRAAGRRGFSGTDFAVACYGACVLVSALVSPYGRLAWAGYEGWYMGAFSQILFVGIYFFVSRQYDGEKWPLYLAETALLLVTVLGLLHKLGIDPLGLQSGWNSGDWVYSHMLSTLGNINWLCGYYSVALAFVTAHFLREENKLLQAVLYAATVMAYVLLGIQGSQSGLLILAICTAVCVLAGWRSIQVLRKLCLVLSGFFLCLPLMDFLMKLRGKKAAVVRDGNILESVEWYTWIIGGLFFLGLFWILAGKKISGWWQSHWGERDRAEVSLSKEEKKENAVIVILLTGGVLIGLFLLFRAAVYFVDDGFGSGRGFLWRIALENVEGAGLKEKLIGAGPDCYAEAVFNRLAMGTDVWKGEYWEGAVFTSAHSEYLNQLCNVGLLGTVSYLAVFLTMLWTCGGNIRRGEGGIEDWLGLLAAAMYGAHSLVSFQQVLNTPLLFLTFGICEGIRRRRTEGESAGQEKVKGGMTGGKAE